MEGKKSGKKAIGIAIAAIIIASVFAVVIAPFSVADPNVPPDKEAKFFLVPADSYVPSQCNDTNVEVWLNVTNTTGVSGGAFNITYTHCCANITSFTPNKTFFDTFTFGKPATTPGRLTVAFMNTSTPCPSACNQPKGVYHLGTFKIHCCSEICCRTNLTFVDKTEAANDGGGFVLPTAVQNGTFTCGPLPALEVTKKVKKVGDPETAWEDNMIEGVIGGNYNFSVKIHAVCCNFTNLTVNVTIPPCMNYTNNESVTYPNGTTRKTVPVKLNGFKSWTLPKINRSETMIINYTANVTDYCKCPDDADEANATAHCNETPCTEPGVCVPGVCNDISGNDTACVWIRPPAQIEVNKTVLDRKKLHNATLDPLDPPADPVSTWWHELHPVYCNEYHIDDFVDNNVAGLSPSDYVLLNNGHWYHVDEVTITLDATNKLYPSDRKYVEFEGDFDEIDDAMHNPVSTQWHEAWPVFSRRYHLSAWIDDGDGVLDDGDIVELEDKDTGEKAEYFVDVGLDIIVSRWAKEIHDAEIGDVYRFNCTIHNTGTPDLEDIRFWDILNCSLEYADKATLKGTDGVTRNITLATTLYLDSDINPNDLPITNPVVTQWHELYPDYCKEYNLKKWIDNNDSELSPSDQILLKQKEAPEKQSWFHVDEVTITLNVSKEPTRTEFMLIDFEGGYELIDDAMHAPVLTQWHEVWPDFSKEYEITNWNDNGDGKLSYCDEITLRNKKTGQFVDYHVEDVTTDIIVTKKHMVFKPIILHPENLSWDPHDPYPISEQFEELHPIKCTCPDQCNTYHLRDLIDTDHSGKLDYSDQVELETAGEQQGVWYHVERVPWTLNVTNTTTGKTMYIDSELDYQEVPLTDPRFTQWNEVCTQDSWEIIDFIDTPVYGVLDESDYILLRNKRTLEELWFHVEEVTKDLVVSREWRIDNYLQAPLTLQPCQSVEIQFDAHVVKYSNNTNTQCAKGYYRDGKTWASDCDQVWINTSHPDLNVTKITVNPDVPYLCDMAFGPTNHTGARTQCNNISAVIEEDEGVDVVFPFNVTFEITNTSTGAEVGNCTVRRPGLGGRANETVYCNCSWYPFAYENYTITVTVDSAFEIDETREYNNTLSRNVTAHEYGYKGNSHQDGRNITALQCHEQGTINLTYSLGNSTRGYAGPPEGVYVVEWTRDDFSVIPDTETCIKKARLYVYYDWAPKEDIADNFTLKFNDHTIPKDEVYTDIKFPNRPSSCCPVLPDYYQQIGADKNYTVCSTVYEYGMVAYNVTPKFKLDGNIAVLNSSYSSHTPIKGMLLVVVYNHPDEPERIIWINEGFDLLKAGNIKYTKTPTTYGPSGITSEEATTYAPFTPFAECPEIPVNKIGKVRLVTVTNDPESYGYPDGPHALYFNGELLGLGTSIWDSPTYGNIGYGFGINETEVTLGLLKATNNTAAIQSYDDGSQKGGDNFEATNAFLILQKKIASIAVEPEKDEVAVGDEFTVNITVTPGGIPVYGAQYILSFNKSVLHADLQNEGDFLNQDGAGTIVEDNTIDNVNGKVSFAAHRIDTPYGVTEPGTLAVIQFTAIKQGACTDLTLSSVKITDPGAYPISLDKIINSEVCVMENLHPVADGMSKFEHNNVGTQYLSKAYFDGSDSDDPDGYITSYIWSFGDGGEGGVGETTEHIYGSYMWNGNSYDQYQVTLTVQDNGMPILDNSFTFPVNVYMAGDANGDGMVDIIDGSIVGLEFWEVCNGDNWGGADRKDKADLNNDCMVDIVDASIVGLTFWDTAW